MNILFDAWVMDGSFAGIAKSTYYLYSYCHKICPDFHAYGFNSRRENVPLGGITLIGKRSRREPYLLYRYAFGQRLSEYWQLYLRNLVVTVGAAWISFLLKRTLFGDQIGILQWAACGLLCAALFQVLFILAFFRTDEYRYFSRLIHQRLRGRSGSL